ncbi:MAG TPA: hypothetical protein VKR31_00315 [Rhizomicrobium sp.]|nr:hypothetical protein [Rhizomicrobium sp.]
MKALECGDMARAQVATLLMQIQEPPEPDAEPLAKAELYESALRLRASNMLKAV